jgi:hypothetical protein
MPSRGFKQQQAAKRHYLMNKPTYLRRQKERNRQHAKDRRAFLLNYLQEHPCVDCGESDPVVLEFDHVDRTQKAFSIGECRGRSYSLKRIAAELKKCDVRCANCHRRRTRSLGHHKPRVATAALTQQASLWDGQLPAATVQEGGR